MVSISSCQGTSVNDTADRISGLHLTPDGYRVLFHELMTVVAKTWPDQLPEKLPMVLPGWSDEDAWTKL